MEWRKLNVVGDGLLLTVTYAQVARWIARASTVLGFPGDTWRPHSLRRGAATELSVRGYTLDQIMEATLPSVQYC